MEDILAILLIFGGGTLVLLGFSPIGRAIGYRPRYDKYSGEGQATFRIDSDDNVRVVNPYEGVMLPKGTFYWFESTGDRNLVMIRTGAATEHGMSSRLKPDGQPIPGDSIENKRVERIEAPGPGFGG